MLDEHGNRRLLAHCRILVHRTDSLAWATLLTLEHGIGSSFIDHIYQLGRCTHQRFGNALLAAYEAGFPDVAPVLRTRAQKPIGAVLGWVGAHALPEEGPGDG